MPGLLGVLGEDSLDPSVVLKSSHSQDEGKLNRKGQSSYIESNQE
jgi:hypothetical protein